MEPLECIDRDGFFELDYIVDDTQFRMILDQLFQSSRYRFIRELQECFVTLLGGHRVAMQFEGVQKQWKNKLYGY